MGGGGGSASRKVDWSVGLDGRPGTPSSMHFFDSSPTDTEGKPGYGAVRGGGYTTSSNLGMLQMPAGTMGMAHRPATGSTIYNTEGEFSEEEEEGGGDEARLAEEIANRFSLTGAAGNSAKLAAPNPIMPQQQQQQQQVRFFLALLFSLFFTVASLLSSMQCSLPLRMAECQMPYAGWR